MANLYLARIGAKWTRFHVIQCEDMCPNLAETLDIAD